MYDDNFVSASFEVFMAMTFQVEVFWGVTNLKTWTSILFLLINIH